MPGIDAADLQVDGIAPRPADVVGPHHVVRAIGADPGEVDVVAALVLDEIGGPDRADVLAQRRADRRPVHQVARVPDDQPRIGVERRERHVVVVAVLQHRRVGVIAGEDRVEEGAVAQVRLALTLDAAGPARLGRRRRQRPWSMSPPPAAASRGPASTRTTATATPRSGRGRRGSRSRARPARRRAVRTARPAARSARYSARLCSSGTLRSAAVWTRKVGGIAAVTCRSIDVRPTSVGGRRLAEQVAARVAMDGRSVHLDDRIEQREEVGPGAHRVERMPGAPFGRVEERAGHPGEVPAGRGAENADPIRLDAELRGPRADDPHCPQHVLQRRREAVAGDAVLEDERRHALGPQPLGRAGRLVGHRQPGVPAAGRDDDRRAGRPGRSAPGTPGWDRGCC